MLGSSLGISEITQMGSAVSCLGLRPPATRVYVVDEAMLELGTIGRTASKMAY